METSSLEALKNSCLINYHVKGWGMIRHRDEAYYLHNDCVTDNFGPERHSQCIDGYNFEWSSYEYDGEGYGCQKTASPSSKNKRCLQLRKIKGEKFMPKKGESLKIIFKRSNGKRKRTTCYYMKGRAQQKYP